MAQADLHNRLDQETSPYLLQHKDNPVAWQPWDQAALDYAKSEDRPILLSIGYAACHWCHVMAHESFEDPRIAAVMNELFVNIKVDREERPDLDTIYQSALALLGEQGGWPLTMFLTPEGRPFWGGTYFPPIAKFGRPGFPDVLRRLSQIYQKEPEKVQNNVKAIGEALEGLSRHEAGPQISLEIIDRVCQHLVQNFDFQNGGIGGAPKFPQAGVLRLLQRAWKRTGDQTFRAAVDLTLRKMSQGGIYDHLGGGYARYAVDDRWLVPHFEKMLYDNAQLIQCLTTAWRDSGDPLYETRVRETIDWLYREMMAETAAGSGAPCGAFAASLDADSEGEEGKFYVWQAEEVDQLLGEEAALFKARYDVTPQGNWEGKTILNRSQKPELQDADTENRLATARQTLMAARDTRIRPGWDDKVLADWNGLMITALCDAAMTFNEPEWLETAEKAFQFVKDQMVCSGSLRHSWRHGTAKHAATLDDYANLCEAALALYEVTADRAYLDQCRAWLTVLDDHFWDDKDGGYFLTHEDAGDLIVRTKTANDSAVPSGNGTILGVLARLYHHSGERGYLERAEALMATFAGQLGRNIFPLAAFLSNAELVIAPVQLVVIGAKDQTDHKEIMAVIHQIEVPNRILQCVALEQALPPGHPAAGKSQVDGKTTVYICRGQTCSLPITDPQALRDTLTQTVRA